MEGLKEEKKLEKTGSYWKKILNKWERRRRRKRGEEGEGEKEEGEEDKRDWEQRKGRQLEDTFIKNRVYVKLF